VNEKLLWSVFFCGAVATLAGFGGFFYPALSVLLLWPLGILAWEVRQFSWNTFARGEKFLCVAIVVFWLMIGTGIFVPETGFDAVWYHLPVIDKVAQVHRITYLPDLYQSLNPLFSDLIFGLGYQVLGEFGGKCVALLFGITLALLTFSLSRRVLDRYWSLWVVLMVSSFQVVAWQSSSFYIDVAKAVWELAAVLFFIDVKKLSQSAFFFGASLATKLFSLFLLPVFLLMGYVSGEKLPRSMWFVILSIFVALPFYFFAYRVTGSPIYSLGLHTAKLQEIGGESSVLTYALARTLALPSSLTQLTLFSRDYTSLIFLVFLAPFLLSLFELWSDRVTRFLLIFAAGQWLIWWYVPPLSTRYALSGFVVLGVLFVKVLEKYVQKKPAARKNVLLTMGLAVAINVLPRVFVTQRNMQYIFGLHNKTTKEKYLQQFYDGSIDANLKKWHHIE
jgi:hypothetical protein